MPTTGSGKTALSAHSGRWLRAALAALAALVGITAVTIHFARPRATATKLAAGCLDMPFGAQPLAGIEESGFYGPEKSNQTAFRWTNGAAKLVGPLQGSIPKAMHVHLILPGRPLGPGGGGFQVRIHVNGQSIFDERLDQQGSWTRAFDLSEMTLGDPLTLEFLSDTFVPAEKIKGSRDQRTLGLRIVGIVLLSGAKSYADVPLGVANVPEVMEAGFHGPNVNSGQPSRWTNGAASLTVPLGGKVPRLLALTLEIPDLPKYRVNVSVNGHKLFDDEVPPNDLWSTELLLEGLNLGESSHIELNSSTVVPADSDPKSLDRRKLGVNVKRLILVTDTDAPSK